MSEAGEVDPPPFQAGASPQEEKAPLMQGGNLVVVAQPVAQLVLKFNEFPVDMVDSKGNHFTTEVRYVNGLLTWVAVGITCLIAGSFGCPCIGLIPLCVKAFKDVEHISPLDGSVVGRYDRGADMGLK